MMAATEIKDIAGLRREVEKIRLEMFNKNIEYANGIACVQRLIDSLEAGLRGRLEQYKFDAAKALAGSIIVEDKESVTNELENLQIAIDELRRVLSGSERGGGAE